MAGPHDAVAEKPNQKNTLKMKKLFLFTLAALTICSCSESGTEDGDAIIKFKDSRFLEALLAEGVDQNGDGRISREEAAALIRLDVDSLEIRNMDEIRYFTALEYLDCSHNQLTSLNVSGNTALWELYCDHNQLTSLDISGNTALVWLACSDNQLTSLDVSNNAALWELGCSNNLLTSLDVNKCRDLQILTCNKNPDLTSLLVYKYHTIDQWYLDAVTDEYGDIITYVE